MKGIKRLNDIMQAYYKGLRDSFSPQMVLLLMMPFICSLGISYFSWDYISVFLHSIINIDEWKNGSWVFIIEPFISLLNMMGLFFYFVGIVLMIQMLLSMFYAPIVIAYLYRYHYSDLPKETGLGTWQSFKKCSQIFLYFILTLLLCIPLYLIPLLNIIVIFIVLFIFFKEMMILDVVGSVINKKDYPIFLAQYKIDIWLMLLSLYLLSMIPVLNIFVPIFQILIFSNFIFLKKKHFITLSKGGS